MTTEDSVRTLLLSASEQRQPRPAPVLELIYAGRRARRKHRGKLVAAVAAAVVLISVGGVAAIGSWTRHSAQPADHGSLNDREYAVAVDIARQDADKWATSITSATATVGKGTVADSNTDHPCTSGTLLHIKLIGEFNIDHSGPPLEDGESYDPVTAVLITADPESGLACLVSVQTGEVTPDPGATLLFTH